MTASNLKVADACNDPAIFATADLENFENGQDYQGMIEELQKLQKRLTWSNLQTAALPMQSIIRMERILDGRNPEDEISREDFLNAVEGLFLV